ncbi:MAG: glutamine-hydrolyzing carbamoyl-phosphate synthase small subunit [Anaerolineae bacterium]|nr:glutamine-hydrolyzing carbamoyl-phosphate synthase small subunit [Anaerolineae bacterium]
MTLPGSPIRLALEDGSIWHGSSFGTTGTHIGEVVFNTSLTGYQEILTDPSYAGQIVVMTAPQIGNTGINPDDNESRRAFLRGFVVRELSPVVSNWRSTGTLHDELVRQGVTGGAEMDTRAITRRLREKGALKGVLTTDESLKDADLIEQARAWSGLGAIDLMPEVTCDEPYGWSEPNATEWAIPSTAEIPSANTFHVVAFDFGIKSNILRRFASQGCRVTIVPARMSADEVLAMNPDGIFLSNGPGDPAVLTYLVDTTRQLLGKAPIFGICLGHQILGQAFGGQTYKLKFGHHGGNQPVKHLPSGRIEISAHNHNYAVDPQTLPTDIEVTHINLNDDCCEGMRHKTIPAISIQYHPEAAPGPHDADPLFMEFIRMMQDWKSGDGG